MLVISRQRDETVMIGDDIEVTVVDIRGDRVRLGILCPREYSVHRKEVYDAIRRENRAAAMVRPEDLAGLGRASRPPTMPTPVPPPTPAPATAAPTPVTREKAPAAALTIRPATAADLPAIDDIYNYYVPRSTCTYQTEPSTAEERARWFDAHGPRHPVTVAVDEAGQVVGWGSLSPFHRRAAYGNTVEDSVYVRHDRQRRGVGRALLADLLERGQAAGHHTVIALIDAEQAGSIALHEHLGFTRAAHLREVGFKFGRWLDVVYLQRML